MKTVPPDVLADRYASTAMVTTWSSSRKVLLERQLWIAALKAERDLGLTVPKGAIETYERVIDEIDLDAIVAREFVLRQDVKARIEEFNARAGGLELIHEGFTSRDLTDNVEQLQLLESMQLIRDRTVAILKRLADRATEYALIDMCGRTHNVPAQTVTLGKRFANIAEEMLVAFDRLEHLITRYPLRGIKGATGTQQDMAHLLGSNEKALQLEERIREYLGFSAVLESVGQVYPRSLDFEVVSVFTQLASAPANLAKMIRLMAGHELAHEGFGAEQTGSTAMPHKMNSRTCERINGLLIVLGGYLAMTRGLLGDQWYEGDVSCSVVRRVALPGACFTLDGLYEAAMTVLDEMEVFPTMIEQEFLRYLPFLSTTRLLMVTIKKGMGREAAHKIIKKHAVAAVGAMRKGSANTFVERLAADGEFPLDQQTIEEAMANPDHGLAPEQVRRVSRKIAAITEKYPRAAAYTPEPIR